MSKNETERQKAHYLVTREGKVVLPYDFTARCPMTTGPKVPNPLHPGKMGLLTCLGCTYKGPFYALGRICLHPKASESSAELMEAKEEICQSSFL